MGKGGHPQEGHERSSYAKVDVPLPSPALLALPALAVSPAHPPSPASQRPAVKHVHDRANAGLAAFKLLYGTNASKSNAFGKCVSKLAQQNEQEHTNAAAQCRTERSADPAAVRRQVRHRPEAPDAFGKLRFHQGKGGCCRSGGGGPSTHPRPAGRSARQIGGFKTKYGTNANKVQRVRLCASRARSSSPAS